VFSIFEKCHNLWALSCIKMGFVKSIKHTHEMECPLSHGGNLKLGSMPSIDIDKNLNRQLS
jgi:hypothetical protein